MNSPLRSHLLSWSVFVLLALVSGCAKVSVHRATDAYAPREANCAIAWQVGGYERLSAEYEWIGELTLHNEQGLTVCEANQKLLEEQACAIGGDTLLRNTQGASANLSSFANHKFGVLRRRSTPTSSSGNEASTASDAAPSGSADERVANKGRPRAAVR